MPLKNEHPDCVLIARFSAIGDVAMSIPVVYDLCRSNPDIQFVLLTKKFLESMFVDRPDNLVIETPDLNGRHRGLRGLFRLANDLKAKWNITAFADLHDVLRTRILRILFRLSGIKVRVIDKGRRDKRRITRHGAKGQTPLKPQTQRYADVFRALGLSMHTPFKGLWGGHAKAPADIPAQPYIIIAPFAAHAGKIYPTEQMEQVIKELSVTGINIILMGGGGDEQRQTEQWASHFDGVTSVAGQRLGFARELELINHAVATIAMDSGNMHLSAIAGTPTVSIWGATHPACGFAPWHQEKGIIQAELSCRPCSVYGNQPCRLAQSPACMDAIDPQTIIDTTLQIIKNG